MTETPTPSTATPPPLLFAVELDCSLQTARRWCWLVARQLYQEPYCSPLVSHVLGELTMVVLDKFSEFMPKDTVFTTNGNNIPLPDPNGRDGDLCHLLIRHYSLFAAFSLLLANNTLLVKQLKWDRVVHDKPPSARTLHTEDIEIRMPPCCFKPENVAFVHATLDNWMNQLCLACPEACSHFVNCAPISQIMRLLSQFDLQLLNFPLPLHLRAASLKSSRINKQQRSERQRMELKPQMMYICYDTLEHSMIQHRWNSNARQYSLLWGASCLALARYILSGLNEDEAWPDSVAAVTSISRTSIWPLTLDLYSERQRRIAQTMEYVLLCK